jgi:hypothetical protein
MCGKWPGLAKLAVDIVMLTFTEPLFHFYFISELLQV